VSAATPRQDADRLTWPATAFLVLMVGGVAALFAAIVDSACELAGTHGNPSTSYCDAVDTPDLWVTLIGVPLVLAVVGVLAAGRRKGWSFVVLMTVLMLIAFNGIFAT
jgi:hypothetical protein